MPNTYFAPGGIKADLGKPDDRWDKIHANKVITENDIQPSTAYAVGATANHYALPPSYYLECTTAGTTATTAPTVTQPVTAGDTITDGTVVWTVRQCLPTSGGVLIGENPVIKGATSNGYVIISAGSGGGYLVLRGANNPDVHAGAELVVGGTDQVLRLIHNKLLYGRSTNPANLYDLGGSAVVAKRISGNSGYRKTADGLLIQWGKISVAGERVYDITYPISFSSGGEVQFVATLTRKADSGAPSGTVARINSTQHTTLNDPTGCSVYLKNFDNSISFYTMSWMAIGRG